MQYVKDAFCRKKSILIYYQFIKKLYLCKLAPIKWIYRRIKYY